MSAGFAETLQMQRLDDGTIRLIDAGDCVVEEFEVVPCSDIMMPENQKRAIAWAESNGYAVDIYSHWSISKWRADVDVMVQRMAFGKGW